MLQAQRIQSADPAHLRAIWDGQPQLRADFKNNFETFAAYASVVVQGKTRDGEMMALLAATPSAAAAPAALPPLPAEFGTRPASTSAQDAAREAFRVVSPEMRAAAEWAQNRFELQAEGFTDEAQLSAYYKAVLNGQVRYLRKRQ